MAQGGNPGFYFDVDFEPYRVWSATEVDFSARGENGFKPKDNDADYKPFVRFRTYRTKVSKGVLLSCYPDPEFYYEKGGIYMSHGLKGQKGTPFIPFQNDEIEESGFLPNKFIVDSGSGLSFISLPLAEKAGFTIPAEKGYMYELSTTQSTAFAYPGIARVLLNYETLPPRIFEFQVAIGKDRVGKKSIQHENHEHIEDLFILGMREITKLFRMESVAVNCLRMHLTPAGEDPSSSREIDIELANRIFARASIR